MICVDPIADAGILGSYQDFAGWQVRKDVAFQRNCRVVVKAVENYDPVIGEQVIEPFTDY